MKDWRHYKKKTYTENESRKMDYELELVHLLITELYNGHDSNVESIKKGGLKKLPERFILNLINY